MLLIIDFIIYQVLAVGELHPPYVSYSYTKSNMFEDPTYYWRLGKWTNCTKTCSGKKYYQIYFV